MRTTSVRKEYDIMPEKEVIERAREDEREGSCLLRKQVNSCAKRWSRFEKGNTGHGPPSKQSRSIRQKRVVPA
jgi:hypothetical protein